MAASITDETAPDEALPDIASLNISNPQPAADTITNNPTDIPVPGTSTAPDTIPPPNNERPASPPKPKKEKKKYPKIRQQLWKDYGLSCADHFVRSYFEKEGNESSFEYDDLFAHAIDQTLTHISNPMDFPVLPKSFGPNDTKLEHNFVLLQVFSVRDISKPQHKRDYLNTGTDQKRMLHFVLTDGRNRAKAVEYQHVMLFEYEYTLYLSLYFVV